MSEQDRQKFSDAIARKLMAFDWTNVHLLHCYEPIKNLNEVNTALFIREIERHFPNVQLFTSRYIGNEWRIVSLQDETVQQSTHFDVIIVPMLGFDEHLHRIGYGGGYYDRFLATQEQAQKIGLCFELCQVKQIPSEAHDIPLDIIVTEAAT
jgi:5,10-methenyltetrahydrofolate synthetase